MWLLFTTLACRNSDSECLPFNPSGVNSRPLRVWQAQDDILTASRHELQSIGHSFSLHLDEHTAFFVSVTSHHLFGPEYMGGRVSQMP